MAYRGKQRRLDGIAAALVRIWEAIVRDQAFRNDIFRWPSRVRGSCPVLRVVGKLLVPARLAQEGHLPPIVATASAQQDVQTKGKTLAAGERAIHLVGHQSDGFLAVHHSVLSPAANHF